MPMTIPPPQAVSGSAYEVADWTALQAVSSPTVGRTYAVLGALVAGGATGTQWQWSGTFWRPAGRQMIYHSAVQVDGVSGGTTSEQFLLSLLLPAGLLRGVREFGVRARWVFSATETNGRGARWRLGTAGTTADTVISGTSGSATNSARVHMQTQVAAAASDTTLRFYGNSATATTGAPDATGSSSSASADLTVSSLTGALYLSATVQQGASPSATAGLSLAAIYVE